MAEHDEHTPARSIERYRSSQAVERHSDRQLAHLLGSTYHRPFAPAAPLHPAWTNYASLRHVRGIDVDPARQQVWLATWGGVLCWEPEGARCTRHTSEHGLVGNSTRCLAVDGAGVVWAAGQEGGLCSLLPADGQAWRNHSDLDAWVVLCIAARPEAAGGVYLALRGRDGRGALGTIATRADNLDILVETDLATREVAALSIAGSALWTGNAWGLHQVGNDGRSPLGPGRRIHALAPAQQGGLWVGTNRGLYRLDGDPDAALLQEPDWPRDEVLCLAPKEHDEVLWVATAREVGQIIQNRWRPASDRAPGHLGGLFPVTADPQDRVWMGGAQGLRELEAGGATVEAFFPAPEDLLGNSVQCLWAGGTGLWVGTAQGLSHFDGQQWRHDRAPGGQDVRAILPRPGQNEVWVGAWRGGLHCLDLEHADHLHVTHAGQPVVSLAQGSDGSLWVSTVDAVYRLPPGEYEWELLPSPAREQIGGTLIQTLGHHVATGTGGEQMPLLWVGTTAGLFCYRPGLQQWDVGDWDLGDLRPTDQAPPVVTLVQDPSTGRLWAGTAAGLYVEREHIWRRYLEGEVRAMAFGTDGTLWLGRRTELERWAPPGEGQTAPSRPDQVYTTRSHGLAANEVTALAVRATRDGQEVWVGSSAGVSRYQTWKD